MPSERLHVVGESVESRCAARDLVPGCRRVEANGDTRPCGFVANGRQRSEAGAARASRVGLGRLGFWRDFDLAVALPLLGDRSTSTDRGRTFDGASARTAEQGQRKHARRAASPASAAVLNHPLSALREPVEELAQRPRCVSLEARSRTERRRSRRTVLSPSTALRRRQLRSDRRGSAAPRTDTVHALAHLEGPWVERDDVPPACRRG